MPRSNRPRGSSGGDDHPELDLERALRGTLTVVHKRDGAWNLQPMPVGSSIKSYSCPGCAREIAVGAAHVVAWRADGIMGESQDLAARRHWHTRCWAIRS